MNNIKHGITRKSRHAVTDIRRYGTTHRSRLETFAQRKLCREHPISRSYAKLIAELQGYHG